MEIEKALVAYLLTRSDLTDLVGTRIFPDDITDGAKLPAVFYLKISDVKCHSLAGQLRLERPVFQFSVMATTKSGARAVNKQIQSALNDYTGILSGIVIQNITLQSERATSYDLPTGRVFLEDLEYEINYVRSD